MTSTNKSDDLWSEPVAQQLIAKHAHELGALLAILHALQDAFGFIPEPAIALIAQALNVSVAQVLGALTFYPHFARHKPKGATVWLCTGSACLARGAARLAHCPGIDLDSDRDQAPDSGLDPVFSCDARPGVRVRRAQCLGNCALGPNAMVHGQITARLDAAAFERLLKRASEPS